MIDMNRRLSGDVSLNDTIREESDSTEWQDWLVSDSPDQETMLAASDDSITVAARYPLRLARSTRAPDAFSRAGVWPKTR